MKEFEYKGHKIEIDYGLRIDGDYADYDAFLTLCNPQIKWFYGQEDSYQGEWFAVGVDKDGLWYYNQGSFGSCSGCDWLQGISSEVEAIEFLKAMEKIIPIGNKEQAIEYLIKEKANLWGDANKVIDGLIVKVKGSELK